MPTRLERKNIKGWKLPENSVYIGPGSKWECRFKLGVDGKNLDDVLLKYLTHIESVNTGTEHVFGDTDNLKLSNIRAELGGKDLVCWCKFGCKCHGDILLKIANTC